MRTPGDLRPPGWFRVAGYEFDSLNPWGGNMNAIRVMLVAVFCVLIAGMASAQTEWVEYEGNPVIEGGSEGEWDDNERWLYEVIEVDGTLHLYYGGNPVGAELWSQIQVGHATSTDGVEWTMDPANPVLTTGDEGAWDDYAISGVAVLHDGSEFRMWYGGSDGEVVRGGYATSPDGSVWTKYEDNPIIDVGPTGTFDDHWAIPLAVVVADGRYQIWYSAAQDVGPDDFRWQVGYAESTDGLSWTKHTEPVIEPGNGWDNWLVYAPSVLFDGAAYHMWYTGVTGGRNFGIGYAVSSDGLDWTKYLGNPLLDGAEREFPQVLFDEDANQYRMWTTRLSDDDVDLFQSTCCKTPFASFVPAAAYGAGAEGSFYVTDLDLSNAGEVQAEYRFSWLPRGEDNSDWISSETFTLGAGQSVRYMNVLSEVFGLEPDAYGAVMVESSVDRLLVMARVYNRPGDGSSGTFGQSMPAISADEFIAGGERQRILFGTENDEMRTNIGCQNFKDSSALINLELLAADGTSLETKTMLLRSWSNDQLNRVFHDDMPMTGAVDVWTDVPSGLFYCYGSVLDNVTNDPTTIPPQ